jgi:voltage-gated potassium channel
MLVPVVTHRDNFFWLLSGLIFLLFTGAIFDQYQVDGGQRLVNISLSGGLVAAVWALDQERSWRTSRITLTLLVLAIMISDVFVINKLLTLLQLAFIFLFMVTTMWMAARQVLFTGNVDGNKIIGAICIYILMGLTWTFAYLLCETITTGSLSGLNHVDWHDNLQDVLYFSFVTVTTLGYGDITPLSSPARFLAYMEAVTGQFYIAILVASLIGIRLSDARTRPTPAA